MRTVLTALLISAASGSMATAQTVTPAPVPHGDPSGEEAPEKTRTEDESRLDRPLDHDSGTSGPDLIVTGTRIVRPNMTSNAPVTVIDKDFLRQRGIGRIEDALAQIPQITPMLGLKGNSWTSGRAEVGLRRLGAGRTLTLLNGQRIVNDANLVPGALIERVDILTGGASAVYGSDAIAGVVNYIVNRRFNGITFDGEISGNHHRNGDAELLRIGRESNYPMPQRNFLGGGNFFGSLAAGKTILDDRLNISGFVTYREAKPMRFSDLDNTLCQVMMNPVDATVFRNDRQACLATEYNPYGYIGIGGDAFSVNRDGSRGWRPLTTGDVQRVPRDDFIQRAEKGLAAGGFVSADLFAGIRMDLNFLYNRSRQDSRLVNTDAFYTDGSINCDNPLMSPAQAALVCGADAGSTQISPNTVGAAIYRPRFELIMRPVTKDWRGSVAFSGPIAGKIRFEASYQRLRSIYTNNTPRSYEWDVYERFGRGLQVRNVNGVPTCLSRIDGTDPECVPIDIFAGNPALQDSVFDYLTGPGSSRSQNDLEVLNGIVSGTLEDYGIRSPFATSGVGFAIAVEQRRDRFQSRGDGIWRNFNIFDGRTRVRELAGEIDVPLVEKVRFIDELSINGGYRISDYNTYDKLVHTWKAELSYAPVHGLRFRGSYNRALRVPVRERLEAENRYPNSFFLDLCAPPRPSTDPNVPAATRYTFEQCSRGGMTRQQYDALTSYNSCRSDGQCPTILINGGNPTLAPERSRSYTAGVVVEPSGIPGLSGSIDYYDINITGAFEWARTYMAFDQCYNNAVEFFCNMYRRDPQTGRLLEVDGRWSNSGFSKTRGVDFSVNYLIDPRRLGIADNAGTFNLSLNGTLTTGYDRQFAPGNASWSCLGYHGFNCGDPMPKWRHLVGLNWNLPSGGASMGITWRYTAGTRVSRLSDDQALRVAPTATDPQTYPLVAQLPGVSYFDVAMNVPLTPRVTARFNVQNLLDRDPPIVGFDRFWSIGSDMNTYPAYYEVRGRTLRVGITATL